MNAKHSFTPNGVAADIPFDVLKLSKAMKYRGGSKPPKLSCSLSPPGMKCKRPPDHLIVECLVAMFYFHLLHWVKKDTLIFLGPGSLAMI